MRPAMAPTGYGFGDGLNVAAGIRSAGAAVADGQ